MSVNSPAIVTIGGRVYGYGPTIAAAWGSFSDQVAGADHAMKGFMLNRASLVLIDDDHASEVAEMLAADAIRWEPNT